MSDLVKTKKRTGFFIIILFLITKIILFTSEAFSGFSYRLFFIILNILFDLVFIAAIYFYTSKMHKTVKKINQLYYTDDLTELPNRRNMLSVVTRLMNSQKPSPHFAFVFVDLDDFKNYNQLYGYEAGDKILMEAGEKLASCLGEEDFISRMKGDEFSIILQGNFSSKELYERLRKIADVLAQPMIIRHNEVRLTACFGVTHVPEDCVNTVEVLKNADMALLRARSFGKDKICMFDEEMQKIIETKIERERQLKDAITNKELYLEYQGIYEPEENKLCALETFCRWNSKVLGKVEAKDFIVLAEENGSIVSIGKWIIKTAFSDYINVFGKEENAPNLCIKISVVQLKDPDFLEFIKRVILSTKMKANKIIFEIDESVNVFKIERIKKIYKALNEKGIRIAFDNFGQGESSLNFLKELPVNFIKFHKSLTDSILRVEEKYNLISPLIDFAHKLKLKVIATCVETEDEKKFFIKNKCDLLQGFIYSKTLQMEAFRK